MFRNTLKTYPYTTDVNNYQEVKVDIEIGINKYKILTQSEKDYLTYQFGGCASIYNAIWKDGRFDTWDKENRRLKRAGTQHVKSHLNFMNKIAYVVRCHGITRDPNTQDFMLVLNLMECSLREYLLQYNEHIIWEERIRIVYDIAYSLDMIHQLDAIHRDLHSGNFLRTRFSKWWYISDFGLYVLSEIRKQLQTIYQNELKSNKPILDTILDDKKTKNQTFSSSETTLSNVYNFKNLPEPRNKIQ
ncbi:6776_t:CDS:2, partial [Dentiscutata erythropus]